MYSLCQDSGLFLDCMRESPEAKGLNTFLPPQGQCSLLSLAKSGTNTEQIREKESVTYTSFGENFSPSLRQAFDPNPVALEHFIKFLEVPLVNKIM